MAAPLEDSVALITGASRGIGRLAALTLADAGARVALVARSREGLADLVREIEASGGVASAATADIADERAVARALRKLRRALGPVDLLVNNAGIVGPVGPTWEVDADEWWRAMEVNLAGTLTATRLVLPEMVDRRRGRIINLTSQAGVFRWPLFSAYSVSKAAIVKLTENLAHETSRFGISVFSFHPGLLPIGMTETQLASTAAPGSSYRRQQEWLTRELEEGRGADPADALELLLRLANGDADPLSGRHLSVHDDLDALLTAIDEVRARDLYVLHPERLGVRPGGGRSPG